MKIGETFEVVPDGYYGWQVIEHVPTNKKDGTIGTAERKSYFTRLSDSLRFVFDRTLVGTVEEGDTAALLRAMAASAKQIVDTVEAHGLNGIPKKGNVHVH